jgi:hypothetical protein
MSAEFLARQRVLHLAPAAPVLLRALTVQMMLNPDASSDAFFILADACGEAVRDRADVARTEDALGLLQLETLLRNVGGERGRRRDSAASAARAVR